MKPNTSYKRSGQNEERRRNGFVLLITHVASAVFAVILYGHLDTSRIPSLVSQSPGLARAHSDTKSVDQGRFAAASVPVLSPSALYNPSMPRGPSLPGVSKAALVPSRRGPAPLPFSTRTLRPRPGRRRRVRASFASAAHGSARMCSVRRA